MVEVNITQLQQFVVGLNRLRRDTSRGVNLHFDDGNHRNVIEDQIIYSAPMQEAYREAGFTYFISEASRSFTSAEFEQLGLHLLKLDDRIPRITSAIAAVNPQAAAVFAANSQNFLNVWYLTDAVGGVPNPLNDHQRAALQSLLATEGGLSSADHPNAVDHFIAIEPFLNSMATDVSINQEVLRNTMALRNQPQNQAVNFAFHTGDWHTRAPDEDNTNETAFDMDGHDALPGFNVGFIERAADVPIHGRMGDDPADFIFALDTGEVIDNRAPENRQPTLEAILASGSGFRPTRSSVDINTQQRELSRTSINALQTLQSGIAPTTPNTTAAPAPGTQADPAPTNDPSNDNNQFNLDNLPVGGLVGAGLGAWLFSGLGRGSFMNAIWMALGALFVGLLGNSIGNNMRENRERREGANTDTLNASPDAALAALAIAPSRSVAFANVNSMTVTGIYPTAEADRSETLTAPSVTLSSVKPELSLR